MTTLSRRAALLSLSAFTVVAEMNSDDSLVETKGILNGRAWNSLSKETKDHLVIRTRGKSTFPHQRKRSPYRMLPEIDRLYRRPYNLVVPIIAIMPIAIAIFQGATEEGVESSGGALTILRNVWSK
jgi:hypothetical protein